MDTPLAMRALQEGPAYNFQNFDFNEKTWLPLAANSSMNKRPDLWLQT